MAANSEKYPKIQGDNSGEWWNPNYYQLQTISEFKKAGEKIGVFDHTWLEDMFYGYQRIEKMYDHKLYIGHPTGRKRMLVFVNDDNELPQHNGAPWREDL